MVGAMHFSARLIWFLSVGVISAGLSACDFKRPRLVDGEVVLQDVKGPEVEGVNATLEKSAK